MVMKFWSSSVFVVSYSLGIGDQDDTPRRVHFMHQGEIHLPPFFILIHFPDCLQTSDWAQ